MKDSMWWRDFVRTCGEKTHDQWFDKNLCWRVGDGDDEVDIGDGGGVDNEDGDGGNSKKCHCQI